MPATSIAGLAALPERVRAFVALRLDAAVDEAIAAMIERLRAPESGIPHDGIRWARRANFHLTLFFLGPAVPRERLAPIADALGAIAKTAAPFEIAARGVGAFPNPARPRVIWVGLHGDALAALAARVAEAAGRCGFTPERRAWSPHLTIGRVRSLPSPKQLRRTLSEAADSSFGVSRIERVILYRSEPGPQSSTYHELAAFPLA
ncbi:MAG TPA: RNA 2',3'-cyclic phosphodiesterase [Candidatus Binataceae bacterium]|nr:RNA 2',3'-cyclic phosphodiesterase [Candidatus Binataceae bacterium]